MGKNFPAIVTLKEKPHLLEATLKLIEKSFHYKEPFHFKIDFAPLMDESNHHHCFILIDENEKILAHIGFRSVNFNLKDEIHALGMLGGIAVSEDERGKGHFKDLFSHVMVEKKDDVAFFLLWSDQQSLYAKFGFRLCGSQFELSKKTTPQNFEKTKLHQLSSQERAQIQTLYRNSFQKKFLTVDRNIHDWEILAKITSADLYFKRTGSIISDYFFLGKGQDLTGTIFEYGSQNFERVTQEAQSYGKVWTAYAPPDTESSHYQFLLAPGDTKLMSDFIQSYTNGKIVIKGVNQMKDEVYFEFEKDTLALESEEFFRGVFGPGSFEELGELQPIFISGLDSI